MSSRVAGLPGHTPILVRCPDEQRKARPDPTKIQPRPESRPSVCPHQHRSDFSTWEEQTVFDQDVGEGIADPAEDV
jgi:hypothetical protein